MGKCGGMVRMMVLAVMGISVGQACESGRSAFESDNYQMAIVEFTRCMQEDEVPNPDLLHRRGRAYMKHGQHGNAVDDFSAAIEADARHTPAWNSRAWVRYLQDDLDTALEDIATARELEADNPRVLDTHAHILAARGEQDAALEAFEAAMQVHSREGIAKTQQRLKDQGFDPGPIDGLYGVGTRGALEACVRAGCNIWE